MRMPKPKAGAFSRALVDLIETRLRALRLSVHAAEKRYGFPPESLRSVLKGSSPSVDRFKKICDALEIDFTLGATLDATPLGATPLGSTLGETPLGATPLGATLPTKLPTNFGGKVGGKVGGIVGGIVGGKVVRGRKGLGHAGRMGGREDGGKIDSCLEGVGIDASSVASSLHRVGESQDCPIVGIVRAGSEIEYWNDQFPGGENISVPGELFGDSGARRWGGVVVRGESMSPIFDDGDILFFDMRYGGEVSGLIGRACVVETAAGGAMVKRLERGRRMGMYNLESYNRHHAVVADVVLRTARPVMWVKKG